MAVVGVAGAPAQRIKPDDRVSIGAFTLFRPRELVVTNGGSSALVLRADEQNMILERSSGISMAHFSVLGRNVIVSAHARKISARSISVSGRSNDDTDFILGIPGKIKRRFRGTLLIKTSGSRLIAIVSMGREEAVASVLAAETAPDTPLEALKAEAVAVRSYLVAGKGRHDDFDFCDTTHCQFLRELPSPSSNEMKATQATRGLVLTYESHAIAAMYTRSCSGRTHTASQLGLPSAGYPYYAVACDYCLRHPARWSSRLSAIEAKNLHRSNEASRLSVVRRLGWSIVQSNDFTMKRDGERVLLEGVGQGHGIGLCQAGAKAMARAGANYRQILGNYYPNTILAQWPLGVSLK